MQKVKEIGVIMLIVSIVISCMAGVGAIGFGITMAIMDAAPQENEKRTNHTVKSVCNYWRDTGHEAAGRACAIAQNESMTEYICPSNDSPNNECWIEDKR